MQEPTMPLSQLPPCVSALFYALAHCLDRRLQGRFPQLLLGVLFARGRRTVTAWFKAAGISDAYRQGYHTLAAAGRGAALLSTHLLPVVASLQPADRLSVALDDPPRPARGPHVGGAGVHRNPPPGPAGEQYVYGHVWVTLAALVAHPTQGVRALPLRSDLYVRRKDVTAQLTRQGFTFATKLERAVEQLRWLNLWSNPALRTLDVVADAADAKRPVLRCVRPWPQVTLFSRLAKNAALWSLPPAQRRPGQRGPLPTYGKQRIELAKRAGQKRGWQRLSGVQYGRAVTKRVKTFRASWRPAGGVIRVVLVQEPSQWRGGFFAPPGGAARGGRGGGAPGGGGGEGGEEHPEGGGGGARRTRAACAA